MKYFSVLILSIFLTQCTTREAAKVNGSAQAADTALDAYLWGAALVEDRVASLEEMQGLYESPAKWADSALKAQLVKIAQTLANYNPANGQDRNKIMFIFDGVFPLSRNLKKVSASQAERSGNTWKVVIEGIREKGVQWRTYSNKVSYTFEITEENGKLCVKDIVIVEGDMQRRLSIWLHEMAS